MTSLKPLNPMRRNRQRNSLFGVTALVVVCLLALALVLHWRNDLANLFWKGMAPVRSWRSQVAAGSVADLEAKLASTTAALADRNALAQENDVLKAMLGRPQTTKRVLGAVILRPPGIPYDTLVIDTGSNSGVSVGDTVFAGGTAAVGQVSEVYTDTSRVTLFSAPGLSYDAQVAPATNPTQVIPVSLVGQGAGSFTGQIPAGSVVAEGDSVLIPGLESAFLGAIDHIDAPSGSSFETLYVAMPVNVFSVRYVEIETH